MEETASACATTNARKTSLVGLVIEALQAFGWESAAQNMFLVRETAAFSRPHIGRNLAAFLRLSSFTPSSPWRPGG